jgi:hypothetical protein
MVKEKMEQFKKLFKIQGFEIKLWAGGIPPGIPAGTPPTSMFYFFLKFLTPSTYFKPKLNAYQLSLSYM